MSPEAQRRLGHALQASRSIQCISAIVRVHTWRGDGDPPDAYEDVAGFYSSANLEEIEQNGFVLTPGRYVGAAEQDDDDGPFDQKMRRLTVLLKQQQDEGAKLDQQIARNLAWLGFGHDDGPIG